MSNVQTDERLSVGAKVKSEKERDRETRRRERRKVNLTDSVISEGSPAFFGLENDVHLTGSPYKTRTSTLDWLKLVDLCADHVGEWYNRKFYYENPDKAPKSNTYTSVSSIIKNGGVTSNNDKHVVRLAERVKELCKVYRIRFETAYTPQLVDSDDGEKGDVMHAIFVRAVPREDQAKPADVLATSNSVDDKRYVAKEYGEPRVPGYHRPVRDNPQA